MSDLCLLEVRGRVATLTMNRPDARNALSAGVISALHARLDELAGRDDCSICVLTGAGKAFCAGMDLREVTGDPGAPLALLSGLGEVSQKLRALPMVVVAKVNGAAVGGGCGLLAVADIAVTYADCKLGFPEVDIGVCPAVVAPWVIRKIGAGPARRVLLTGGLMSGREAHRIGLVDHCADSIDQFESVTQGLLDRLAQGGPMALRTTKDLLNTLDGSKDAEVIRRGAQLSASVMSTPETQAILRARVGG